MLGLSMAGPGRRTADPVPDETTVKPASRSVRWACIERFWRCLPKLDQFVNAFLGVVEEQRERAEGGVRRDILDSKRKRRRTATLTTLPPELPRPSWPSRQVANPPAGERGFHSPSWTFAERLAEEVLGCAALDRAAFGRPILREHHQEEEGVDCLEDRAMGGRRVVVGLAVGVVVESSRAEGLTKRQEGEGRVDHWLAEG